MSLFLWIIVIFFAVVVLAVIVSPPSPEVTGNSRRKLPRSANRGGG
jgi:hypothetical protein